MRLEKSVHSGIFHSTLAGTQGKRVTVVNLWRPFQLSYRFVHSCALSEAQHSVGQVFRRRRHRCAPPLQRRRASVSARTNAHAHYQLDVFCTIHSHLVNWPYCSLRDGGGGGFLFFLSSFSEPTWPIGINVLLLSSCDDATAIGRSLVSYKSHFSPLEKATNCSLPGHCRSLWNSCADTSFLNDHYCALCIC